MNSTWKLGIITALGLVACAGTNSAPESRSSASGADSSTGAGPFPSEAEIDELAEQAAPKSLEGFGSQDVDSWELTGPFPERIEVIVHTGDTPWEDLLAEEAQRRVGLAVPTEAMHCVARELGLFYLAHQAVPTHGLRSFIASRCNAAVPTYRIGTIHALAPEPTSDGEVFERWRADMGERVHALMSGGPSTVGIWFGRRDGHAVAIAVAGTRELHVDPVDAIPATDGRVAVSGEVLSPAAGVGAMISRGRFGYTACDSDPNVAPPRFAFSCESDPSDEAALISITYTPPGRLLGKVGLNLLVWPAGERRAHYQRPSYGAKREVSTAQALRSRFVELLNDVRAEAGLRPVSESKRQSAVASELAPHYFAASQGLGNQQDVDIIVMGMLAGWNVDGVLQTGHFTAPWVTQTNDVDRLLSESLLFPGARAVLLAPDIDRIAVGALIDTNEESPTLAAVVGTYSLFSETEHGANVARVYEIFQAERARRDLRPAERLEDIEPLSMAAASQVQAGMGRTDALEQLLQSSVDVLQRPVNGWIAEVSKLEDLEFPDDFLNRSSVEIAVGVSYHKPDGEPWGRYVVMLVAAGAPTHRI